MRASAVTAIIFANTNDDLLKSLTEFRSTASVPFGAQYRLVDFALSNLVNAGIKNIGIITKENYHSLMDHVEIGHPWDLDRKNGGLTLLPPYVTSGVKRYIGTVDALKGTENYIKHYDSDYIVLCDANIAANVDIAAVMKSHIANEADITLAYANGKINISEEKSTMILNLANNQVTDASFGSNGEEAVDYSIGVTVISKELLLELVNEADQKDLENFYKDVVASKLKQLKVCGYLHEGYCALMTGTDCYFNANMDLLKAEVRRDLFNRERPIMTKTRDDMPTRYGIKSDVKNSLLAEGCVIEGTVKNSILFRGVKVGKGAVVENCILMQDTVVEAGAEVYNVISDKKAVVSEEMVLKGTDENKFFIKKNQII